MFYQAFYNELKEIRFTVRGPFFLLYADLVNPVLFVLQRIGFIRPYLVQRKEGTGESKTKYFMEGLRPFPHALVTANKQLSNS
jgi:hypothetical protein